MNIVIHPSQVKGAVDAPPSKSITHRVLIAASLAKGTSVLSNALFSDDTTYTMQALQSLGVGIKQNGNNIIVEGTGGLFTPSSSPIFLGNSGTSMRLLTALCALVPGKTELTGEKRLCERPVGPLLSALQSLGVHVQSLNNNDCPPVIIEGGSINGGEITLDASVSSQYLSALLFIAPLTQVPITIHIKGLKSKPYVDLTIGVMKQFGITVQNENYKTLTVLPQQYKAADMIIEGDYSSASYFFAAAAITNGKVTVKNLNPDSKQGDAYFITILEQMGCRIKKTGDGITVEGTSNLKSVDVDLGDYPDIEQTVAVVAAFAKGKTTIKNIARLKHKETDRISATAKELKKMALLVEQTEDGLVITGGKPKGASIDTYNDHRMAMSFAVGGLGANGETTVTNAQVVSKSYTTFFDDLKKVGAKMEEKQ